MEEYYLSLQRTCLHCIWICKFTKLLCADFNTGRKITVYFVSDVVLTVCVLLSPEQMYDWHRWTLSAVNDVCNDLVLSCNSLLPSTELSTTYFRSSLTQVFWWKGAEVNWMWSVRGTRNPMDKIQTGKWALFLFTQWACRFTAVQIQSNTTDTATQAHLKCVVCLMVQISYNKLQQFVTM